MTTPATTPTRRAWHLDEPLLICAGLSVVVHLILAAVLHELPPVPVLARSQPMRVRVIEPPAPPPEPTQAAIAPVPAPPVPTPPLPPPPKPKAKAPSHVAQAQSPTPSPEISPPRVAQIATTSDPNAAPVFGVSMESVSQGGTGPALPVGNSGAPGAPGKGAPAGPAVKPAGAPIQAFEATKPPLPSGRCAGKYTQEAHDAGIEGSVVFDLTVGADGRVGELHVMSGLPHGLTEAATAALRACHFTPGEKDGVPVVVHLHGFKVTFHIADDDTP